MSKTPGLKIFEKGMEFIDLVADSRRPLTAKEVSDISGQPISTVYKFLITAVSKGYLDYRESDKTYSLGIKFLRYASIVRESMSIVSIAYPLMCDLAEKSQETVHLGVPRGYYGIFVEKVISPQVLGVQTKIGSGAPLNKGATQKAIMAFLPEKEFSDFCKNFVLVKEGNDAVQKAIEDRKEIRKKGYSISFAEVNQNIAAVSAPVFGFNHEIVGSLAIAIPFDRFSEEKRSFFVDEVINSAAHLSTLLGN